jgi:hypothetical protein
MQDLLLINDDEPRQFAPRKVVVVRDDVRVDGQPGIAVKFEPVIENAAGGPLDAAVLLPRHKSTVLGEFVKNPTRRGTSVFVCRFQDEVGNHRDIAKAQISIVFWGLLGSSTDFSVE